MKSANIINEMVILEKDGEKWFWEISTFQTMNDECYGSAMERNKKITFPWVKIEEMKLTETMVKICEDFMAEFNNN